MDNSNLRTVQTVISNPRLQHPEMRQLVAPTYTPDDRAISSVGLAVESMKDHVTDEGWQLFKALEFNGFHLEGFNCGRGFSNVPTILQVYNPKVLVLQDKREWDDASKDYREPRAKFHNVQCLRDQHSCFKLTIIKDAHQRPQYHRESADEIGCHAWITYYHPTIICHLAPYIRPQHLIRTYHTLNPLIVPEYIPIGRKECLLSGAVSGAYPIRTRLIREQRLIPEMTVLPHPGYHRRGCNTKEYIHNLSLYKVAICTSSIYGYSLRKIIEATAAGCRVITDLPIDDKLPTISDNLYHISPDTPTAKIRELVNYLCSTYDPDVQDTFSKNAVWFYDYKFQGKLLVKAIEEMRSSYNGITEPQRGETMSVRTRQHP